MLLDMLNTAKVSHNVHSSCFPPLKVTFCLGFVLDVYLWLFGYHDFLQMDYLQHSQQECKCTNLIYCFT